MSEMTAKEYLKTKARMTQHCKKRCSNCELSSSKRRGYSDCVNFELARPEEAISIIQKWSNDHTVKTRQSEFLNMYPNVERLPDGCIALCPHKLDLTFNLANCSTSRCGECKRGFWFSEVE